MGGGGGRVVWVLNLGFRVKELLFFFFWGGGGGGLTYWNQGPNLARAPMSKGVSRDASPVRTPGTEASGVTRRVFSLV